MSDTQTVRVAMIASVVIAVFSFIVAPLLYLAPDGLWQVIRIFTGFYNIPIVTIVLVGLFTKRAPAIGAKLVIVFHVITYGLLKFAFADVVTLHFLHLYAVLFFIELAIMLIATKLAPRPIQAANPSQHKVDLTPWRHAPLVAALLFCLVIAVYIVFSPVGIASSNT
jgi:SSS family solute:Na+ symporter